MKVKIISIKQISVRLSAMINPQNQTDLPKTRRKTPSLVGRMLS